MHMHMVHGPGAKPDLESGPLPGDPTVVKAQEAKKALRKGKRGQHRAPFRHRRR